MAQHSREEVERIVRQYVDSYASKDKAKNLEVIHPEHVFGFPEMNLVDPSFEQRGGKAVHEMMWDGDTGFLLDFATPIERILVDGDVAFVEGYLTGSKIGPNPMTGEAPKDATIKVRYSAVWEIEDHMIKRVYWYYDLTLFYMVQLGMEPAATVQAFTDVSAGMAALG